MNRTGLPSLTRRGGGRAGGGQAHRYSGSSATLTPISSGRDSSHRGSSAPNTPLGSSRAYKVPDASSAKLKARKRWKKASQAVVAANRLRRFGHESHQRPPKAPMRSGDGTTALILSSNSKGKRSGLLKLSGSAASQPSEIIDREKRRRILALNVRTTPMET